MMLRRLGALAGLLTLGCTPPVRGSEDTGSAAAAPDGVATDSTVSGREVAQQCLDGPAWSLASLRLGKPGTAALQSRPTLTLAARDTSEDDGGYYEIQRYRDGELAVDVVRGSVDRLASTTPSVVTPWGIRVGLTRGEVGRRLAEYAVMVPAHGDTIDVPDCGAPSAYLTLVFDSADRLDSLELALERP